MEDMNPIGFIVVFLSGLIGGYAPLPVKFMRRYGYEHWGLVTGFLGYLAFPWAALFAICPDVPGALADVPLRAFLVGNAFSMAWGLANVLYCISLLKIGFSLTTGILAGIAIPAGVVTPMILKGSGKFAEAPAPLSPGGLVVLAGVATMLAGVVLLSRAGFARDAARGGWTPGIGPDGKASRGGFVAGLVMCVAAGILSIGISFSYVYTQDAIGRAFLAHGTSEAGAPGAVRTVTLLGGALVNLLFPLFLLWRNRSWGVFAGEGSRLDFARSAAVGAVTIISFVMASTGMSLLGGWGPSVGFGVNQAMQILGSQSVGLIFGEWRGVPRPAVRNMVWGVVLLLLAVAVISCGNAVQ